MMEQSLPLWAEAGIHPSGAAWEALDFDGRPVASPETRVRVQARQLYCFALAHTLGWRPAQAHDIVAGLLAILTGACRRPDGLYGRRIGLETLELIDDTPDLYDNAFALLALATARDVLGSDTIDPHVGDLLRALDEHIARRKSGGYAEYLPAPSFRLQNPHMHLFEAMLAVYAVNPGAEMRDRIETLHSFIDDKFFDRTHDCVSEYGDPVEPSQAGFFEPGHSMEWVWLLGWHARLFDEPYPAFGRALYARALETLDDSGRAMMKVSHSGEALDPSRRLWSQTETLKAHLCMAETGSNDAAADALERAAACSNGVFEEWLHPAIPGGWLDHFDERGALLSRQMPASSGYHVYCAIAELARLA